MHLGPVGGGVGAALFFVGARENGEHGGVEKQQALSSQEARELQKKMKALDRKIAKADEQIAAVEGEIAAMSAQDAPDFEAIGAKTKQVGELKDQRDELEMEWLELGEQLEG